MTQAAPEAGRTALAVLIGKRAILRREGRKLRRRHESRLTRTFGKQSGALGNSVNNRRSERAHWRGDRARPFDNIWPALTVCPRARGGSDDATLRCGPTAVAGDRDHALCVDARIERRQRGPTEQDDEEKMTIAVPMRMSRRGSLAQPRCIASSLNGAFMRRFPRLDRPDARGLRPRADILGRPPSSTSSRVARCRTDLRCATMTTAARRFSAASTARSNARSPSASRKALGSSRISKAGSPNNARASATRCACPADKPLPSGPRRVS